MDMKARLEDLRRQEAQIMQVAAAVGEEERAGRLSGQNARQGLGAHARGDDHRAAGLGHQAGGSQFAAHAAGS